MLAKWGHQDAAAEEGGRLREDGCGEYRQKRGEVWRNVEQWAILQAWINVNAKTTRCYQIEIDKYKRSLVQYTSP